MDTKSLRVEIKDADRGEVVAIFSTFNVIDHDGDVTVPGAFEDGAKTRISAYNHGSWGGELPVGVGTIKTTPTEAQLHGRFFMDIAEAAKTFQTVKAMSAEGLQEWSYGYDVLEYAFGQHDGRDVRFLQKQKVNEVSPVLLGAGIGTRTVLTKSAGLKFSDHALAVLTAVGALSDRAAEVLTKRQEQGKHLGVESAELLQRVEAEMGRLGALLKGSKQEPDQSEERAALLREHLRFLALNPQN
jgi:HK97 family phage prohead protease